MHTTLVRLGMALHGRRYWRPVEQLARRPDVAQQHALQRILRANHATRFGRMHGFADPCDVAQFQERVPIQEYEALRPFVDEQRRTGAAALTAEAPVFYAQTSGTTGRPKYIPITPSALAMHRSEQALFTYLQYRACPEAFDGKAWGIMGAAVEGRLDTGHAVGAVSGHLYQSLPRAVRSRFVVPPSVSSIADYDLKYLTILRLAIGEPDISYIGSPNPSTFLRLLDVLNDQRDVLLTWLATGTCPELARLPADVVHDLARRLRPDPARASTLAAPASLTFENTWPRIRLLTTWMGGSCGIALETLRRRLPAATKVMELGYQSSEFRGTIALDAETPSGLPPLHHHFIELAPHRAWDDGRRTTLTLAEVEVGQRYYVIVTTIAGLYRYFMNDLVDVTGFFERTPLLRFVQKGKGQTSLTGEKLYEAQVIDAVQNAAATYGLVPRFFQLVGDEQASTYRLFVEVDDHAAPRADVVARAVDEGLARLNIEYDAKRKSGRLRPLTLAWLKRGSADAYKAACIRQGQREGQFKPAALQYRRDLVLSFDDLVLPT
jgi:hypothetical protein